MGTAVTPAPFAPGFSLQDGDKLDQALARPFWSTQDGVTALAGGGKAGATPLTATISRLLTVATAADSALLPPALVGKHVVVINDGAAAAQIFGQGTDTIDGVATGTGVALTNGKIALFFCTTLGAWHSMAAAKST